MRVTAARVSAGRAVMSMPITRWARPTAARPASMPAWVLPEPEATTSQSKAKPRSASCASSSRAKAA